MRVQVINQLGMSWFGATLSMSFVKIIAMTFQVTCDTISLIVEGETYNMDYDFGRRGVRDLGW